MRIFYVLLLINCCTGHITGAFKKNKHIANETRPMHIYQNEHYCMAHELTLNQAISDALRNNKQLQADFYAIGIAESELEKAGLYTNPNLKGIVRFPFKTPNRQPNIETDFSFRLSDLWQVPLKKRVAQDQLEKITARIMTEVLDTTLFVSLFYYRIVYTQTQIKSMQQLYNLMHELYTEITYQQAFGYTTILDIEHAYAHLIQIKTEIQQYEKKRINASLALLRMMGKTPTMQPLPLSTPLDIIYPIPALSEIQEHALMQRPELKALQAQMQQAHDSIQLERAKNWQEVNIGVSFKQDYEKPFRGIGPLLQLDIPIFDDNRTLVKRAEQEHTQAQRFYAHEKIAVTEEVKRFYTQVSTYRQIINHYDDQIIPALQKAVDYAAAYVPIQINTRELYEAQIKAQQAQLMLNKYYYKLQIARAHLERAYGKRLE